MNSKALEDVTVLDLSHLLQGPFATQLLADLGATVIKVERPGQGDLFRTLTFNNRWLGGTESPNFLAWNRNKRSLALDLKATQAREVIYKLVEKADIVVENFRPGVLDRLGFGYEDLKRINPRIIYCSGSGYGDSGPYLKRPGQDMLIQGLTGLAAATGRGDGPPVPVGAGFSDQVGAMNIVYGALAALYWRERSGVGQHIKVNLLAGMLAHQGQEMLMAMNFETDFERPNSGIGHPGMDAPFGVYPTKDGWVTVAMSPYSRLVGVLGDDSLLRYDNPKDLFEKRDEIWARLAERTATWNTEELMNALLAVDIWCGEVKTHLQAEQDPQVQHLGAISYYDHPIAGRVKVVAPAVSFSATPAEITRPAPLVGQHSREILAEYGFSEDTVNALIDSGTVAQSS
ncbi:CaiB/BaiF CoA transferase family protein [Phyllobacterium myrsinacearum]|jgi:crotonobetainyl-CoA:carnitine CoA-transferase CaiB-like acyl-CoA transferase|uniref:Carnitine dehydratase n=1 Tax=Phyllobacterium myrsinacearum TaxID=28101 RepID=A0A2S9JQV5_9HYPH|nr:CaiB/BaiF CoA-transferase family protein [Phyllobacterium myrsinacearum]PRD55539.1 carnitine dehydratase [Phyllobacterium myrsinacearum]PWV91892.1 crotonobetainyl-CoA:carnitine CoA-transferase CaiB-like acyl-CoA transferase [Phyllobacterium myrsinacearum]RZV05959.1 crotonobetainyl-CoA:carnitine CoA-transferase CaiB-like acyl-CoA transferase [Phyllobacterium myrsinacearum]